VLVTVLTKRLAEDLTNYLDGRGLRVRFLHSDIDTLARLVILRELREGAFDVLIGVNLLREGLDLPEVSLVCILDADKTGFLRSTTSLIQTMGRAARNVNGSVIMYADRVTDSMRKAIDETGRRREVQEAYNQAHGITPQTIRKAIEAPLLEACEADYVTLDGAEAVDDAPADPAALVRLIAELRRQMRAAARELDFEGAAALRDRVQSLQGRLLGLGADAAAGGD
jgi:excinuclease ABC subunit B